MYNRPPKKKKQIKKRSFDKKYIIVIIAILFFVLVISLFNTKEDPNKKYYIQEEEMVNKAKKYVLSNNITTTNEIYIDSYKINVELSNECDSISGVFYDGIDYMPYLKCNNYESKILNNNNESISLIGDKIIVHAKGMPFYDPGYTSNNNVEVAGTVGQDEGVYNLYYYIKGDSNFLTRKVIVVDSNEIKDKYPKISLNGSELIYVMKGQDYNDPGVTATDSVDGDISKNVVISSYVDTNVVGKQVISYNITNSRGYKNAIEREVNVVDPITDIYFDYKIDPINKVNSDVTIIINVSGNIYEYIVLPSGEKSNENSIRYKVSDNGKYNFLIYDKTGNVTKKEIEVSNIDKDPPKATCDAIIYNDHTIVEVYPTSSKPISSYEYQINNISVKKNTSSTFQTNIKNVTSAIVIIEDSVGNKTKATCDIMPYTNWIFDYSKVSVYLKNSSDNTVLKKYSMEKYLKGIVYLSLSDINYNEYSDSQLSELFKTFFILKKAELLSTGKYSIYNKQLIYDVETANYCDIYLGCKLVSKNGKSFYIPSDINYKVNSDYGSKLNGLNSRVLEILNKAYDITKKEVTINKSFDEVLVKYTSSYVYINDNIKKSIIRDILANKNYRDVLSIEMPNYKVYNITSYSAQYNSALKTKSKFYWPIGSAYADYRGLFTGTPESTEILYNYGVSSADNKVHDGLAIKGTCGKTKVIASKGGKVTSIGTSNTYGSYVVIQHDNGVSFLYGSLEKSSIAVKAGNVVKQGQLLGYMGNTNGTCMLYIETKLNGVNVDPNEYISLNNLRPVVEAVYVDSGTVKRSVCSSLLASGFSVDATAGLMANIERESDFNLQSLGDRGTSVGLFQWHGGRYTKLSDHCGDKIYTVECQLDYLMYELKNNYKTTYDYLLGNSSAYDMAHYFCYYFEKPSGAAISCPNRGELAKNTYVPYVLNNCK